MPTTLLRALLLLLLVCAKAAAADSVHFRVLICKPAISTAIKRNLDEAKISMETFESTYDRLSSSGEIKEIFRGSKEELMRGEAFRLTGGESNPETEWRVVVSGDENRTDQSFDARIGIDITAPGKDDTYLPFQLYSAYNLPVENWSVLAELPLAKERILWLARVTGEPLAAEKFLDLNVEGRIISMSGAGAETVLKKSAEELAKICDTRAPTEEDQVFRFRVGNTLKTTLVKGNPESAPYSAGGYDEKSLLAIELQGTLSPDRKLADFSGFAEIGSIGQSSSLIRIPVGNTLTLGEWKAIAVDDHADQRQTAVLFIRATGIGNDTAPVPHDEANEEIPEKGSATRNYPVHPSALRVLSAKKPDAGKGRDARQIFVDAGMEDGSWRLNYNARESSILFIGDAEFHKKFIDLLGDLRWTK